MCNAARNISVFSTERDLSSCELNDELLFDSNVRQSAIHFKEHLTYDRARTLIRTFLTGQKSKSLAFCHRFPDSSLSLNSVNANTQWQTQTQLGRVKNVHQIVKFPKWICKSHLRGVNGWTVNPCQKRYSLKRNSFLRELTGSYWPWNELSERCTSTKTVR